MPLDPNIVLQAGRGAPRPRSALQTYGNVLAIQNAQDEMEDRRRAREQSNALRAAMVETRGDPEAAARVLMQYGDVQGAVSLQDSMARRRGSRLDNIKKEVETIGMIASGVKNPESWSRARVMLGRLDPQFLSLPEQYDPALVDELANYSLSAKQLADMSRDERDFEERVKAREETARHNRATEGLAARGAYSPRVSVAAGEKEEAKKVGSYFGDLYVGLQQAASEGNKRIANLNQLDRLLDQVSTGRFAGTKVELSKALSAVGVDPTRMAWLVSLPDDAQIGAAEAATALSNEMALQLRNPAGGAGMPGAMSDKDRDFLQAMMPSVGTTRPGRKLMVEFQRRINRRNAEIARAAREYRRKHGRLDEGFEAELAQRYQSDHLFGEYHTDTGQLPRVRGPADLEAIPSGGFFVGPDGVTRQKM